MAFYTGSSISTGGEGSEEGLGCRTIFRSLTDACGGAEVTKAEHGHVFGIWTRVDQPAPTPAAASAPLQDGPPTPARMLQDDARQRDVRRMMMMTTMMMLMRLLMRMLMMMIMMIMMVMVVMGVTMELTNILKMGVDDGDCGIAVSDLQFSISNSSSWRSARKP